MFSTRFPVVLSLILGLALSFSSSSRAAGFSCDAGGGVRISAVTNNPFTADLVQDSWEVLPDGTRRVLPLTGTGDFSKMPNPRLLSQVARDSEGPVMVRSGILFSTKNGVPTGEPYAGHVTICDPVEGTITTLTASVITTGAKDRASGERIETVTLADGKAEVKPWENRYPAVSYRIMHQSQEDLGFEQIEGVQVDRIRFLKRSDDEVAEGAYTERWLSEELAAQISWMRINPALHTEKGTRLINLRREEPDSALYPFQIPVGYIVVHKEAKPYPFKNEETKQSGLKSQPVAGAAGCVDEP